MLLIKYLLQVKRGVGRMCNVLFIPRKNEYEYVKEMYKRNMENLKI